MNKSKVQDLKHGLYRVHWKKKHGGGSSLAAVGTDHKGCRWIAPTNWISGSTCERKVWKSIKRMELIEASRY